MQLKIAVTNILQEKKKKKEVFFLQSIGLDGLQCKRVLLIMNF